MSAKHFVWHFLKTFQQLWDFERWNFGWYPQIWILLVQRNISGGEFCWETQLIIFSRLKQKLLAGFVKIGLPFQTNFFWEKFSDENLKFYIYIFLVFWAENCRLTLPKQHSTCPNENFQPKVFETKLWVYEFFQTLAKNFGWCCPNCILRVQRNILMIFFEKKLQLEQRELAN